MSAAHAPDSVILRESLASTERLISETISRAEDLRALVLLPDLEKCSLAAARAFRFSPATRDGVAIKAAIRAEVKFVAPDYRQMRCTIGQWRPGKGFALFPGSTVPFFDLVDTAAGNGGAGVNQMGRGRYRNLLNFRSQ